MTDAPPTRLDRRAFCAVVALVLAALAGGGARAQIGAGQVPPLSSPIERLQPAPQPQAVPRLAPAPAPSTAAPEGGPAVTIRSVEVSGSTVYSEAELAPSYAGLVGRTIPQGAAEEAIRRIQLKYREDGYFLTVVRGAFEGTEDAEILRIRVVEGFISNIKVEGDIGPAGVLAYRYLQHLTAARPANIADVERALLLVQGIPGVSARAVLRPGAAEIGAVELVAQLGRKAFGGIADYDNRGSEFAGTGELLLTGYANSFTSLGEVTQVTLFNTPLTKEQIFGQVSTSAFIGSSGLKIGGYFGAGISEPGGFLALTGYKGHLTVAGINASYPIIRTRPLSLYSNLAFDLSRATIDTFGSDGQRHRQSTTNLRILRAGGALEFQDDTAGLGLVGANAATFTVHKGIDGLGASRNSSPLPARIGNVIDFLKVTTELTRVQNLFDFQDFLFALKASVAGQYTEDILPPNEEFFLGGARYGRGFFSGEVTGDRAIGNTFELQASTVTDGILNVGLQYYAFYDHGVAWSLEPGDPIRHIESAGLGVRADLTPQLTGEIEVADRFTRHPTGTNSVAERAEVMFVHLVGRF
jgi:hemolysin activation/secretion protein